MNHENTMRQNNNTKSDEVQQKASEISQEAKQKAKSAVNTAQQKVTEQARTTVDQKTEQAANELNSVADAVRQSGDQFRDQELDFVAQYTDRFAEQVEGLSSYLSNSNLEDMVEDAEDLGRRQPELFLAGAFALGILAGRFFKSSNRRSGRSNSRQHAPRQSGYRQSSYGYESSPSSFGEWSEAQDEGSVVGGFHNEPMSRPTTNRRDLPTSTPNRENDFTSHTGDRPGPLLEDAQPDRNSSR